MNDIPMHILKICKQILSPFSAQLFNRCVKTGGIYPECLKCAQVIPIHEGGQKNHCANYTPISLLSPSNKIFEKLIYRGRCGTVDTFLHFQPLLIYFMSKQAQSLTQ